MASAARLARRLRDPRLRDAQTWRLVTGLVLFTFALTHFLNHALGHISVETMEEVQAVRRVIWRSWPGTIALYGALALHVGLALWKLILRRTWRLAPWEVAQIVLGLSIPFLAAAHVAATRGLASLYGFDDTYGRLLSLLWPGLAFSQSFLLVVVWLHAVIGLHFWLRTKAWYERWSPLLLVLAVMIPTVALTGWMEGARRLALMANPPTVPDFVFEKGGPLIDRVKMGVWFVFGAAAVALVAMRVRDWFTRGPAITYPGRTVRGAPGATLLEISRAAGVPHASVCGGRGRCTTCRVLVTEGEDRLALPNRAEAAALTRIHAPEGVRLACQIRPDHALKVRPLIPLHDAEPVAGRDMYRWGVERRITVMFSDLRGFTTLAERLYPYDSVFLLNRYFEVMSEAIERHGGEVDKFLGDGIMALFGVSAARGAGSRAALYAARDMFAALERLNQEFDATLAEGLRMGIGLHMGPAVLGRVGAERSASLTALGDTVNTASRLESLNKEFGSVLVVSDATVRAAGLAIEGAEIHEISVRGRGEMLTVHVATAVGALTEREAEVEAA
ncbi:MAG: adenylate/guanylate cyclase domain-containing protein [Microvirga sp.]